MSTVSETYKSLVHNQEKPFQRPDLINSYEILEITDDPDDGFVPFGVTILTGEPGCGKTSFATAVALAVAAGEPFAGVPPKEPEPVGWFAAEEDMFDRARLLAHRYTRRIEETKEQLPFRTFYGPAQLDNPDTLRRFLNCLNGSNHFAVLDPLAAFVRNPAEYRDLVLTLRKIGLDYGITFLLPHWSSANGPSGGPGLQSAASAVWCLSYKQLDGHRLVRLEMSGRAQTPKTLQFRSEHPLHYELVEAPLIEQRPTTEQDIRQALTESPKTPEQLSQETGHNLKSVRNTVIKLVAAGVATIQGKVNRSNAYVCA